MTVPCENVVKKQKVGASRQEKSQSQIKKAKNNVTDDGQSTKSKSTNM